MHRGPSASAGTSMKVELKLFATLMPYLPPEAEKNAFTVEVEPGTDPAAVIKNINAIPTVHRIEVA